jgi:cytochrome c oxidase subunit 3
VVTGAHGIHLLGGMAAVCFLLMRAAGGPRSMAADFRRQRSRSAVAALYWHFLTLVWLGVFLLLIAWP